MDVETEKINFALKDHQSNVTDWQDAGVTRELHMWSERIAAGFKLNIRQPAIRVDSLRSDCYGHFVVERNGFGILNEVALNKKYLSHDVPSWRNIGTLVHELLHCEQKVLSVEGKSPGNYHNKNFRERAKTFGLVVDRHGHTEFEPPPSRFWNLLKEYGIDPPANLSQRDDDSETLLQVELPRQGNSKLKLWVCGCSPRPVHVRVAIADFQAKCLKCGQIFTKA